VVAAGGEIGFGARRPSGVVTAGGGAVAGAESPEAADGGRLSGCVLDEADELTSGEITGFRLRRTGDRSLPSPALTLLVGVGRILAQDKLLYQAIGEPAPGVDERVGENQSRPAIA
jgi:hypothetical protein